MTDKAPTTVLDSLNLGLHTAMQEDSRVYLLGEDLLDPYGGSFKVTRGLSSRFPDRVWTTPISEAGIVGVAGGMALRGLRPVVEIMFGDFTTLIADQLINHLTKFNAMYAGQVGVPVVIRTPMGGRRGYGPTHSQTLEKLYLGVPGLTVLAPFHLRGEMPLGTPGTLLHQAITTTDAPVFFVENKLQYLLPLIQPGEGNEFEMIEIHPGDETRAPFYRVRLQSAPPPRITLAAYGYMAHLAMDALKQLAYQDEIFAELLVPTQLAPFELDPIYDSVQSTHRLLTVEEGSPALGWGAEVLARTAETLGAGLHQAARIGAQGVVVPASPQQEAACLPDVSKIINRAREMVR